MTSPTLPDTDVSTITPDVYLCGPIGNSPDKAAPIFGDAARVLREAGLHVFNPMEFQNDNVLGWHDYMRMELPIVMRTVRAVVVLPGWEFGVGSHVEVLLAVAMGVPIHAYDPETGLGECLYEKDAGRDAVAGLLIASTPTLDVNTAAGTQDGVVSPDENLEEKPHEEAARIVLGPRGEYYDHPYDNFARTGLIWTGVLYSKLKPGEVITPEDVALCMVGVKMAREAHRHKRDNIVDGHGYFLTHQMVVEERQRRNAQQE